MSNWEADLFALTYEDKMTVKRHIEQIDDETGISNFNNTSIILTNIPCALSKKDESPINGDVPSVISNHKVFTGPEHDIKAGDLIDITRHGRTYHFVASEPFYYISHIEIPVERKGRV